MSRCTVTLCVVLVATALTASADDPAWEVRFAGLPDQTDEWTAAGRIPGWDVTVGEDDPTEVRIGGDEAGAFRGTLLIGKRWTAPDAIPAELRVSLEYQTYCASDEAPYERSGEVSLALITPERWEQFADEPEAAEKWARARQEEGIVAMMRAHANREDVLDWRAWESPNLRSSLREYAGEELVLAIVWSAYHFVEEWAAFRGVEVSSVSAEEIERAFLERVDADYPGLEAFKAALGDDDLEAAKLALVEHFRARTDPTGPPLATEASARTIERADEVLEHIFRSASCPPTKIEGPIRWNEDPHNYDQWAIHLNRHFDWLHLGRAYAHTGDAKYAREFVALLNSWLDAMPVTIGSHYVQGPHFVPGRTPLTLDAGIRMAQTWWPAYYHFRAAPEFDANSQFRMLLSFVEHADYLMNEEYFHVENNWGAMEANGLFHIAAMLPEMREAKLWLDTARERLIGCLDAQVYPDGAQKELTPGYHRVTLGNILGSLELAQRTGTELPEGLIARLEAMFEYFAAIAMPDGRTPAVNDAGWGRAASAMAEVPELFPERADLLYAMTGGRSGVPPTRTSWHLPWAGWSIMRTGWTPQDSYLFFESGPFGRAHQHEDKLGIICHVAGKTVLTEGGTYSYDRSDWRRYVLSTRAHNTVMVDGLEQHRRPLRETWVTDAPTDAHWFSDDAFDYARGVYDDGYGDDNAVRVAHERQVLFVKPGAREQGYWIVCDKMTPEDAAEHTAEALFHLDAEEAEIDPATGAVTVAIGDTGFRILPVGSVAPEVEIVQGQTEPQVQGWLPTGRHNELRPIPTAVFRWRAAGPSTMAFLLLPRDAGDDWPVSAARAIEAQGAFALEAQRTGGGRDVFVSGFADDAVVPGACETDAEAAMVRFDATGAATSTFASGGGRLDVR